MASTVIIWNNNMVSAKLGIGHLTVGHACMNINNQWAKTADEDNTDNWVSWWPGENSTGPRKGEAKKQFADDLAKEGYVPDHILRLVGLNEPQMLKEWKAMHTKENAHYRLHVKNCSTLVARVLRAGTSWTNRNVFRAHSVLWTPLQAKRFAINLGGVEVDWPVFLRELAAQGSLSEEKRANWANRKKRSNMHGNPNTRARFVDGVDTTRQEQEATTLREMSGHFRSGKHVDRSDKETRDVFKCKLCSDNRPFWPRAKELAAAPAT